MVRAFVEQKILEAASSAKVEGGEGEEEDEDNKEAGYYVCEDLDGLREKGVLASLEEERGELSPEQQVRILTTSSFQILLLWFSG